MRRFKRLVGPICVLGAAVGLWFGVGIKVVEWRSTQFTTLSNLQAEALSLEARSEQLQAEILQFSDQDISDLFWIASQAGEATALVQSSISNTASSNGILLRSVTPFMPRDQSIQGAFGFRLEFETRLDQLTEFLKSVEYDRPALVVENVVFRRLSRPGDTGVQPVLFVQVELLAPVTLTGEVN